MRYLTSLTQRRVPLRSLYRYASSRDIATLVVGSAMVVVNSGLQPTYAILFSKCAAALVGDRSQAREKIDSLFYWFIIAGGIFGVAQFGSVYCFRKLSESLDFKLRYHYVESILEQEVSWHDENPGPVVVGRVHTHLPKIKNVYFLPVWCVLGYFSRAFICFIVALIADWKLTLVGGALFPVVGLLYFYFSNLDEKSITIQAAAYSMGARIASEVLAMMKTVWAFGTSSHEEKRYGRSVESAYQKEMQFHRLNSLVLAGPYLPLFILSAIVIGYGAQLVRDYQLPSGEKVVLIICCLFSSAEGLGSMIPWYCKMREGQQFAVDIFDVIDRKPRRHSDTNQDERRDIAESNEIRFQDMHFSYPSRPEAPVMQGLTMSIPTGKITAIVGSSGSGKSTILSLLLRLYEPTAGSVSMKGIPIHAIDLHELRNKIGFVDQSCFMLPCSIYSNIALGKPDATMDEVVLAATTVCNFRGLNFKHISIKADAHDFIESFPDGYDTLVGDLGDKLSGGQRVRIAISRALVREPELLLLDEVTSALDSATEIRLMEALEQYCEERKSQVITVIVSHRLQTVMRADQIIVIRNGVVAEIGTHESLISRGGQYCQLLQSSTIAETSTSTMGARKWSKSSLVLKAERKQYAGRVSSNSITTDSHYLDTALSRKMIKECVSNLARRSRWVWLMSFIFSIGEAAIWPIYSVLLVEAFVAVLDPSTSSNTISLFCVGLTLVGVGNAVISYARLLSVNTIGARMTLDARKKVFQFLMQQTASWFDARPGQGELEAMLARDAALLRQFPASQASIILIVFTLIFGLAAGIYSCYSVALLTCIGIPFTVISCVYSYSDDTSSKPHSHVAEEAALLKAISSPRNILAMNISKNICEQFKQLEHRIHLEASRRIFSSAVLAGITHCGGFALLALPLWYSSVLISQEEFTSNQVLRAMTIVLNSAIYAGLYSAHAPSLDSTWEAAIRLFPLLVSENNGFLKQVTTDSDSNIQQIRGKIEFRDVSFEYPTRKGKEVLQHLSIVIPAGTTAAFVGPSGSGKSTIISLLEGFYPVTAGEILVDDIPLAELRLQQYRKAVVLVSQETRLFDTSIQENIIYGAEQGEYSKAEIQAACRAAEADAFISDLPMGYQTQAGDLGGKLSGGQRQRILIARMMLREKHIKIVLLDEATSSLDSEVELGVASSLRRFTENRTCITVAHRLNTILHAHIIFVLNEGGIVEQGSHIELIAKRGQYFEMCRDQGISVIMESPV